ncbi:MAG: hypothetical protein ACRCTZ_09875 [Sarcina sp.]
MRRNKVKKGYLILEVVVYIALVGVLLVPIMNIGVFLFKNYNEEKVELQNKINFIELNDTIKKYVEEPGTEASIETSIIVGQKYLSIKEAKNRNELYRIDMDKNTGLIVKRYDKNGNLMKLTSVNHDVKEFNISENLNVLYIEYIFKNGYKDVGVYEK